MSHPLESRRNYMKTLNDQLLTKTQSDILIINRHQAKRSKITLPQQLMPLTERKAQTYFHKTLNFEQEESINLVGDGEIFYKLDCTNKTFPLRITFRKVKGQLRFLASFKQKYPDTQQADYNFIVDKDIRRAIPARLETKDTLYICFVSTQDLGMMKIFVDSYTQHMQKISKLRQQTKSQSQKVIKSGFFNNSNKSEDINDSQDPNSQRIFLTPIKSRHNKSASKDKDDYLLKNKSEATNFKEISSQKLIKYREKQLINYQQSKLRRQQIQKYKQKNREFKTKTSQSKQVILFKKAKMKEQIVSRDLLIRNLSTMVEICKFFSVLKNQKEKYIDKLKHNARITNYQACFVRKIKNKMRQSKDILPFKVQRDKANLRLSLCLIGWALQNKNMNKISTNVGQFLSTYSLASKVNGILNQATQYRRKVRFLQKVWKLKYHTRFQIIEDAGKKYIKSMLTQFKNLKIVQVDFEIKGILKKIIIDYIKQVTIRFNFNYISYFKRLDTLADIEKMNKSIAEQNTKLAKRNQKPLLRMPPTPPKPYPCYFRDLDTLKSTIRSWFELESKKYQKRQKKIKQSKKTKQGKNKNNQPQISSPQKSPQKQTIQIISDKKQ